MIKSNFLPFLLLFAGFISCKSVSENTTFLPILDLAKNYPVKKVSLHDIAEVEYVPLETTDHSLLTSDCSSFCLSDEYIVTRSMRNGDIFFFNRSGKHLRTINRKGGGSEEYARIILLAVDFIAEECFVSDGTDRLMDSSDPMKYYYEAPQLVWNRHTGEMENWEVYDLNFSSKSPIKIPSTFMQSSDEANYGFGWCTAETLLKEYAKGRLNGKLEEIAPTLKMDDNKILTICKYK